METKRFAVVGTDARQASAGRALERAGYVVGGAEQVARADCILLPLPLDESRTPLAELLRAAKPGAVALGGKLADAFTPLAKGMNSEYANQNGYDCIQVHGGSGFMLEYACQRIYRDARITSIYEGTTQLQTVAAIRYVTNGFYSSVIEDYAQMPVAAELEGIKSRVAAMAEKFNASVAKVKEAENQELHDLCARHLYEMAADVIMCHLLMQNASKAPEIFMHSLEVYANHAEAEVAKHATLVERMTVEQLDNYRQA